MRKITVFLVLVSVAVIIGCGLRNKVTQPVAAGRVYGVFEVPDSEATSTEMVTAGFTILTAGDLRSRNLRVITQPQHGYYAIPFDSITIRAGQQTVKTASHGAFSLTDVTVSPRRWSIESTLGKPIPVEYLGLPRRGQQDVYIFISRASMQDVHVEPADHHNGRQAEPLSPFGHMGCTHCKYFPDCAMSLSAGIQWCWDEHRYNLSLNDPRRFCNGQPKSYLGGTGYNCSYFWGRRQCP